MPIQYERDDVRHLVTITMQGVFSMGEMLEVIERQRAEATWSYGRFYDLRRMTGDPTVADLREIMKTVASFGPTQGPRGPIALLTSDPILYSAACAYAALGRSTTRVRVFRDMDEAILWLAAEASL